MLQHARGWQEAGQAGRFARRRLGFSEVRLLTAGTKQREQQKKYRYGKNASHQITHVKLAISISV
jgi:hypothetical protein